VRARISLCCVYLEIVLVDIPSKEQVWVRGFLCCVYLEIVLVNIPSKEQV
jgi:hypothetical protein